MIFSGHRSALGRRSFFRSGGPSRKEGILEPACYDGNDSSPEDRTLIPDLSRPQQQRPAPGFLVRDAQGNEVVYPVTMTHIFSDAALQTLVNALTGAVLDALEVRGVVPSTPDAPANAPGEIVQLESVKPGKSPRWHKGHPNIDAADLVDKAIEDGIALSEATKNA